MPLIEYKFYLYVHDRALQKGAKLTTDDMLFVGSCQIETTGAEVEADPNEVADAFNARLRAFLVEEETLHFIPLRCPTREAGAGDAVCVCYYQDKGSYDIVYGGWPERAAVPAPPLMAHFEALYEAHGLDGWDDPRANTTVPLEELGGLESVTEERPENS